MKPEKKTKSSGRIATSSIILYDHRFTKVFLKKLAIVKNVNIPLCVQKTRGAIKQRAEIIPKEPDAGNAAEGKGKVKRKQVHSPVCCRFKPF